MKQLYLLFLLVTSAVSYKILCIHMVPSKSHFHLVNGVVQPLLKAGHQILFATPYPEAVKKHDNITVFDLSSHNEFLKNIDMSDPDVNIGNVISLARDLTLATIKKPVIQEVLVKDQLDAVVTEWFFTDIDAGYAAIQQVPWIVLSGNVMSYHVEQLVDAVRSLPIIPSIHTDYPMPMSFWHRLWSTISYAMMMIYEWKSYQVFKSDYEENFGPLAAARGIPLPPFGEIHRNVSILLSDSHPSFSPARSIPPNVVEIAGYHIDANIPELPKVTKSYQVFKSDYEENFGPLAAARGIPLPPFGEIHRNVSILLSDSHPSFSPARSIPPNVVEIAGYHIDANIPELPKVTY
ncbi:unnamed protein product [Pieris macdunnoughi]|uniref:Uncharacterized protein n=1 Tax=Pieris macdunnoughi TaxID=345717 RepID=A0A821UL23_9NEOP|nr:unnamed protein product [Pieris macdunnoughi]